MIREVAEIALQPGEKSAGQIRDCAG